MYSTGFNPVDEKRAFCLAVCPDVNAAYKSFKIVSIANHIVLGIPGDITFIRGPGGRPNEGWLAAFTNRYKLIVSPDDKTWLIDRDPDELKNYSSDPAYQDIFGYLAKELLDYGMKFNKQRIDEAKIRADLEKLTRKR